MQSPMVILSLLLLCLLSHVWCDTPANCTYDDIVGTWIFYEGERNYDNTINCSKVKFDSLSHPSVFKLEFPDIAIDSFGNQGTWTLIYNQGFEVIINSRKYFAFSKYIAVGLKVKNYCHETLPGWSHDIYSRDWSCYIGQRISERKVERTVSAVPVISEDSIFHNNEEFFNKINEKQNVWEATSYTQFEGVKITDIVKRLGGPRSRIAKSPGTVPITLEQTQKAKALPEEFDWRNVSGRNFVSPVRNQGNCGSCYAFGSLGMMEARYRILTNNSNTPVFSTEDIVECSYYSQGCLGGFAYLIAGKYAEDFGLVLDECNPYNQTPKPTCQTNQTCRRYYGTDYRYVGGFYGGCNELLMRLALVKDGPVAVSFEVYPDFMHYKGGIYHHTGITDNKNALYKFNPFHITNHVVVIVGYGTDAKTSTPYWTVKNSWGTSWGEDGYFKIRRGNDECSIESIALESTPIPTY